MEVRQSSPLSPCLSASKDTDRPCLTACFRREEERRTAASKPAGEPGMLAESVTAAVGLSSPSGDFFSFTSGLKY